MEKRKRGRFCHLATGCLGQLLYINQWTEDIYSSDFLMVHEIYRAQWLLQGTMKIHGFCRRAKARGSPHAGEKQLGSLCPAQGGHPAWRHDCGAQGAQSNPCWGWSKETWNSHETNPRKPSLAQENRKLRTFRLHVARPVRGWKVKRRLFWQGCDFNLLAGMQKHYTIYIYCIILLYSQNISI